MSGAWAELRSNGQLGDTGARLLYDTVDAVRRYSRMPPPEGETGWSADGVLAASHDFVVRDPERLGRLAATATSEDSFERLLYTAVLNDFRAQARRTDRGAALRAMRRALKSLPDAVLLGPLEAWTHRAFADEPLFGGSGADLVVVAYSVEGVRRATWRSDSERRPPLAHADSLERILSALLQHAAAPVATAMLLDVMLARFPLALSPSFGWPESFQPGDRQDPSSRLIAFEIWAQLSDSEQLVLGLLDAPVREVASQTGLSRGSAHRAMVSARRTLAAELTGLTDEATVITTLAEASNALREFGTNHHE